MCTAGFFCPFHAFRLVNYYKAEHHSERKLLQYLLWKVLSDPYIAQTDIYLAPKLKLMENITNAMSIKMAYSLPRNAKAVIFCCCCSLVVSSAKNPSIV